MFFNPLFTVGNIVFQFQKFFVADSRAVCETAAVPEVLAFGFKSCFPRTFKNEGLFFFCDTEGDSDWFLYRLCCFFVSVSFVSHFDQMRVMPCREKKMIPWKKSHLRSENIIYLNFCKITNQVIWSDISNTRQNQRLCILQEMGFERWFCMDFMSVFSVKLAFCTVMFKNQMRLRLVISKFAPKNLSFFSYTNKIGSNFEK